MSYEEFFKVAILKLRDVSKSRGIHSVFTGFNQAFREYFGEDPVKVTQDLASRGLIAIRPVKRGVMIYLPDDAPPSREVRGKKALETILGEPSKQERGLVKKVIEEVAPNGAKIFPDDFLDDRAEGQKWCLVDLPGTRLQLDSYSQSILVSLKKHFRYEGRNPSEAKFILYAHKLGLRKLNVPKDNRTLLKAVAAYESYCQQIRSECFNLLVTLTHDEATAELLTGDAAAELDLRAQ